MRSLCKCNIRSSFYGCKNLTVSHRGNPITTDEVIVDDLIASKHRKFIYQAKDITETEHELRCAIHTKQVAIRWREIDIQNHENDLKHLNEKLTVLEFEHELEMGTWRNQLRQKRIKN